MVCLLVIKLTGRIVPGRSLALDGDGVDGLVVVDDGSGIFGEGEADDGSVVCHILSAGLDAVDADNLSRVVQRDADVVEIVCLHLSLILTATLR